MQFVRADRVRADRSCPAALRKSFRKPRYLDSVVVGRLIVVCDAAVRALLEQGVIRSPGTPGWDELLSYMARSVGHHNRQVDLELRQAGVTARAWIALPESARPMPWLVEWQPADNARTWVDQFVDWLDEEMYTGGLGPTYRRTSIDGIPRLTVRGYGFELADEAEHRRLRRVVGPHGWHAPGRVSTKQQYAAEWALDHVEQELVFHQVSSPGQLPEPLHWVSKSPGRIWVRVEGKVCRTYVDAVPCGAVQLVAKCGPRQQVTGRRLVTVKA